MRPGDRITIITRISERLSNYGWREIDLFLRQFGFPTSDDWNGLDQYGYCIHQVERGHDDALVSLHDYLYDGDDFTPVLAADNHLPWEADRFRLFISHLSADKVFVASLKAALKDFAIDGFVAHVDIEPTKEWVREIEVALDTCHALTALLTPHFHESRWTDQEIGFCVKRRVLIVPLRAGLDPYGFVSRYQGLTLYAMDGKQVARDLFDLLVKHEKTETQMASALVSMFAGSDSYADAKRNVGLLQFIKTWTPELLDDVEKAVVLNDQIADAFGVPGRVDALLKQHRPQVVNAARQT